MRAGGALVAAALVLGAAGCGLQQSAAGPSRELQPAASSTSKTLQTDRLLLTADKTSSKKWVYVDPDAIFDPSSPIDVYSSGLVSVALSGNFTGAPVNLRVTDNGKTDSPKRASFVPGSGVSSFGFTFSRDSPADQCGHTLRLEWRSPTGQPVKLRSGTEVILFKSQGAVPSPCPG